MPPDATPEGNEILTDQPTAAPTPDVTETPVESSPPPIIQNVDTASTAEPDPEPQSGEGTPAPTGEDKVELRHGDFKRIKDKARKQGESAARAAMEKRAKELGFNSLDEALTALKKPGTESSTQQKKKDQNMAGKTTSRSSDLRRRRNRDARKQRLEQRKAEKTAREKERAVQKWRNEEKRRRAAQKKNQALRAEMELRTLAHQAGVQDVDYAMNLLARELKGKSEAELKEFSEGDFFTGLKTSRPYLFGEREQPATTGTAGAEQVAGGAPPEPGAGQTETDEATSSQFDGKKASDDEYHQRLQELGLTAPM